jgi:hypothetical protein
MKIEMNKKYKTFDGQDVRIICVDKGGKYPVVGIVGENIRTFTETGVSCLYDDLGLVEISPFADFKDGDPVMVRNIDSDNWNRRFFSHLDQSAKRNIVHAYISGATKWASYGATAAWVQCRRPTAEEL